MIQDVRAYKVKEIPVDFGIYINADDIVSELDKGRFSFYNYKIAVAQNDFVSVVEQSGLLNERFPKIAFQESYLLQGQKVVLQSGKYKEMLAQAIADFLRKAMLRERKKFSFETVFSHPSKLDIMREAADAGYKVYLYFISTESAEINKFRVKVRSEQGGHDVPEHLIESRYYRSLDLLYEAAQLAYQAFFFDNSVDGQSSRMFAHFKVNKEGKKIWDPIDESAIPNWFITHYLSKVAH